jgi:SprT-like protein
MEQERLTAADLQALVEKVSLQSFHRPFRHQALVNKRLRTTGGRYLLDSHNIEFNYRYLNNQSALLGIIKHELCHYHLHLAGRGFRHRDRDFKVLLARVGGLRYAPALPRQFRYRYVCTNCGCVYLRQRRLNTRRFVCGKCRGRLELSLPN